MTHHPIIQIAPRAWAMCIARLAGVPVIACLVALLMAAPPAAAQYGDDPYGPGYGGGEMERYGRAGYPPFRGEEQGLDLPDRAAAYARSAAQVAAADRLLEHSRDELLRTKRNLLREWSMSSELQTAYDDVVAARQRLADLRGDALAPLRDEPLYQQALNRAAQIDVAITRMWQEGEPDRPLIAELARERMSWLGEAGRYRQIAMDDPDIRDARQDLVDASRRFDMLRERYLAEVDQAPVVVQAREDVREALERYTDASVALAASAASFDQARRLEVRRYDRSRNYSPWTYGWGWNGNGTVGPFFPANVVGGDIPGPSIGGSGAPVGAPNSTPNRPASP